MEVASAPKPAMREPTLLEALIPVVAMGFFVGVGYAVMGIRIELLLLASAAVTAAIAWRLGMTWELMQQGIVESIGKAMPAILIVIVVGALIASWLISGTIPTIVYYGLKMISPSWFLATACILCSLVSMIIGTSWGTIGTVGVALMGIAEGLGVSSAQTAGAVVAGAYFGDKLSPFSDTTNLAPIAAKSNLYDHIGHMLWTTMPAWVIGMVVYVIVGRGHGGAVTSKDVADLSAALEANFHLSPILLLPAAIALGAAVLKKPVIPGMLLSIVVALVMALTMQNLGESVLGKPSASEATHPTWVRAARTLVFGVTPATDSTSLNRILARGGMESMMGTTLIAICAFAFAGIATRAGMMMVIVHALSRIARTTGQLVAATVAACLTVAGITGNSYLAILIPGELFAKAYKERGLAAKNLSRTTEDSGTVVVPLIPWSISAAFIGDTLHVSAIHYAPWAILCYLGFMFALVYGFTGFTIAPLKREDETLPGS